MTALFRTAYNQDADMIVAFMRQLYAGDGVPIDVQTASRVEKQNVRAQHLYRHAGFVDRHLHLMTKRLRTPAA